MAAWQAHMASVWNHLGVPFVSPAMVPSPWAVQSELGPSSNVARHVAASTTCPWRVPSANGAPAMAASVHAADADLRQTWPVSEAAPARAVSARYAASTPESPPTGLLSRIGGIVDMFENRLDLHEVDLGDLRDRGGGNGCGEGGSVLRGIIRRGLVGQGSGPDFSRILASAAGSSVTSTKDEVAEDIKDEQIAQTSRCSNGFTDVGGQLRAFLDRGAWDVCTIEQASDRIVVSGVAGLQRFRQACMVDGATMRGWVCGYSEKLGTLRIRLIAVELPKDDSFQLIDDRERNRPASVSSKTVESRHGRGPQRAASSCTTTDEVSSCWMAGAFHAEDGVFGVLHADDAGIDSKRGGDEEESTILPMGSLVRARLVQGAGVDRRLLRACDASCMLTLVGPAATLQTGVLSRGFARLNVDAGDEGGDTSTATLTEWPVGGAAHAISGDPHFANKYCLTSRLEMLGLRRTHSTLLAEDRGRGSPSRGMRLSSIQGRRWADKRVREGVSRARAGDQKGALERYDAALDLYPRHKEGLVARGAALTNVGRLKEALRDFDMALKLDPGDANAAKYREIARKRAREESGSCSERLGKERKRRRTTPVPH
eukprot:TRINITY_DN56303_c0_g1_i1.p1 TRINITY_DN56303_c0_g1~~TRINITY_DN56303_c0_g1_i1.p1  ORF type:complete len:600 (+),score=83.85 TRINITY_DN56303_c0_g1_i1:224-2023(+)